jgi:hypothetical protein
MKNFKKPILTALISFCFFTNVKAQTISLGAGPSLPSSDTKGKAFISNATTINGDVFLVLKQGKPHIPKSQIDLGINASATYNFGGSGGFGVTSNPFVVTGQTSSIVSDKGHDPKSPGFKIGAGPQANFYFGKFIVSPMFLGEYFSMAQNEMSIVQTTQYNGQSYDFNLATLPETKTSGFAITPKLRLQYKISERFALFADASYTMGPKTEIVVSKLIPNGSPQTPGNTYKLQQLETGTIIKGELVKTAVNTMGFNFGVAVNLRKSSGKHESNEIAIRETPIEEVKLPVEIQKLIDEQDKSPIKTFENIKNKNNQKTSSLCNFNIEKVDIQCNGKDQQGKKRYKVSITYKNLATSGVASLGHYLTTCSATATNGSYLEELPIGSATISNLLPTTSVKTIIAPGSNQTINFDFVPNSTFASLNIKGNLISSAINCGNCDDIITLNLPDCCDACELNPVRAENNSINSVDTNAGTINVVNTVTSPNLITRIQVDLVAVKVVPINTTCNKCNNIVKQQDNFVDINKMVITTGWANSGLSIPKPDYPIDGSRTLTFNSSSPSGIDISAGAQITHTIGVAPTSCCGDTVEIWIRYTLWDKDCKVCDKLVKTSITRPAACNSTDTGGTGNSPNASQVKTNSNLKN